MRAFLLPCLESLHRTTEDLGREALVSDDVSKDGSDPSIPGRSSEAFFIGNEENLKFAKVNNQVLLSLEEIDWCYRSRKTGSRIEHFSPWVTKTDG